MADGFQLRIVSIDWGRLQAGVNNPLPLFKAWQILLLASAQKTFREEGRGGWAPLSEVTKKLRRTGPYGGAGRSMKIGRDSGRLMRSLTGTTSGMDGIRLLGANFALIGTNVEYAGKFAFGAGPGMENVPASIHFSRGKYVNVRAHSRRTSGQPARPIDLYPEDHKALASEAIYFFTGKRPAA